MPSAPASSANIAVLQHPLLAIRARECLDQHSIRLRLRGAVGRYDACGHRADGTASECGGSGSCLQRAGRRAESIRFYHDHSEDFYYQ